MNSRRFATLGFRLVAIFGVACGLPLMLPSVAVLPGQPFLALFFLALPLVFAAVLWALSPALARITVKDDGESVVIPGVEPQHVAALALAVAGLLMVVSALPSLVSIAFQYQGVADHSDASHYLLSGALVQTLRLVLGVVLLLGSARIAGMLAAIRFAGRRPA